MTPEYIELKSRVERQRKVIARKQKLADAQRAILGDMLDECTHEEVEKKSSYYSGDYYNKAHSEYWNQCKLCGKCSEKTTEMHSYYG